MIMTRVAAWNSEDLPIYEPGLAEVVQEVSFHFSECHDVHHHCHHHNHHNHNHYHHVF